MERKRRKYGNLPVLIASDYTLDGVSLRPQYRRPFDIIAKGPSHPNWLPEGAKAGHWEIRVHL